MQIRTKNAQALLVLMYCTKYKQYVMWENCASLEITFKRIFTFHLSKKNHNLAIFIIYSAIAKRDIGSFNFKISIECDTFFFWSRLFALNTLIHKMQEKYSFFLLKNVKKVRNQQNDVHSALQRKSHLCIRFLGIAGRQSQFPHLCVYSQDRSTYFLQQNRQIDCGNF